MGIDIHTAITELTGLYDSLNERWGNDPCSTDAHQVYRQKEYRDVYEKMKDVNIDSIALKIIADSVSEKIMSRLRGLIQVNIQIYETRKDEFNSINFDKLYTLWEDHLLGNKRILLLKDRETISNYPYPSEREREMLLKENQREINELDNERYELHRADASWIGKNYYLPVYEFSCSFTLILDSYFPIEIKTEGAIQQQEPEEPRKHTKEIDPDEIFRTKMFDKLLALEKKLIADKYLSDDLHWLSTHDNGKADIKKLVIFLTALIDNKYFLPNRDPKIKSFFEARYQISIGQNFEKKRREPFVSEYRTAFFDYPF